MPSRDLQQSDAAPSPATWESTPWIPEDRVVEEPLRLGAREPVMQLTDENVVDADLDGDAIRRV